jgi:hypothetical protein
VQNHGSELPHGAESLQVEHLLLARAHLLQGAAQLVGIEGLPEEAQRAGLVDGRLGGPLVGKAGEEDPAHVGPDCAQPPEQLGARHLRHPLVGDHVERRLRRQRHSAGASLVDLAIRPCTPKRAVSAASWSSASMLRVPGDRQPPSCGRHQAALV